MTEHNLTLRKINGKYYQLGYFNSGKWVNLKHLGTAKKILALIDKGKE